jgi:hypothetical protein
MGHLTGRKAANSTHVPAVPPRWDIEGGSAGRYWGINSCNMQCFATQSAGSKPGGFSRPKGIKGEVYALSTWYRFWNDRCSTIFWPLESQCLVAKACSGGTHHEERSGNCLTKQLTGVPTRTGPLPIGVRSFSLAFLSSIPTAESFVRHKTGGQLESLSAGCRSSGIDNLSDLRLTDRSRSSDPVRLFQVRSLRHVNPRPRR